MSVEKDSAERRSEYDRRMRVRRIAGFIKIATGVLAVMLVAGVVGVFGSDQVDNLTFILLFVLLLWFAGSGPADWLAEQIEAWLSSPIK